MFRDDFSLFTRMWKILLFSNTALIQELTSGKTVFDMWIPCLINTVTVLCYMFTRIHFIVIHSSNVFPVLIIPNKSVLGEFL